MRTISATLLLVGALVASVGASGRGLDAGGDVRTLAAEIESLHPEPFQTVSRQEFHRLVDDVAARAPALSREELIVETMRLVALLGERNGHGGLFPLYSGHPVGLRAYPLRLWRFPDGYYVTRARDLSLVGARIVAVGGVPIAEVEARLRPLVSRDNEWSLQFNLPYHLISAEVLRGLGLAPSSSAATFRVVTRSGAERELTLGALPVEQYQAVLGTAFFSAPQGMPRSHQPLYLRLQRLKYGLTPLQRGRALYLAYNETTYPGLTAQRLLRLARNPKVRRVVVDLRLNGGGDNTRYYELLAVLRNRRINRPGRLVVLTSRVTFSAAGNFAAEVDRDTTARFFGEPTGGAPNNFGNVGFVDLATPGVRVFFATQRVRVVEADDPRTAIMPDVPVPLTAADYFAGRDPVLAAALR